ncbi:MAG: DUF1638 domain-containing protein [Anaerolineales bacterium]|nr:DUF1638 domain-containing protein [Anaerolineales bacterium]
MPDSERLPVVVIACKVFQGLLEQYLPDGLAQQITFLDYGLHRVPRNLRAALQERIDAIQQPSLVVLGYGLCGNGLHGLRAGLHTLLAPRTDDCIALLLGSYQAYRREFDSEPATYWLCKGWLESGSNPLQEYREYVQKYGQAQADWLMNQQYQHYKRLALVAHQAEDLKRYRQQAQEVAAYCARWGLRYEEILGSDEYVCRLVRAIISPEQAGDDFVVALPGEELAQRCFLRI